MKQLDKEQSYITYQIQRILHQKRETAISQSIAEENNILWKNIYSGIFRDLDEILIPLGIVEEEGRLPLKRGPKALQQNGMPFYHLTKKGMIAVLIYRQNLRQKKNS